MFRPTRKLLLQYAHDGLEWIDLFRQRMGSSPMGGFSPFVGLSRSSVPPESLSYPNAGGTTLVARYSFPDRLGTPHGSGSTKTVDLATILAVFDEVSTWALFGADRTRRPGVSVSLSATAHWSTQRGFEEPRRSPTTTVAPPRCGENLEVVTTVQQLGRTLGFLSVELRRPLGDAKSPATSGMPQQSELIASGRHVKYLPMPGLGPRGLVAWDWVFHPAAAPLAKALIKPSKEASDAPSVSSSLDSWFASLEPLSGEQLGEEISISSEGKSFIFESSLDHRNGMGTTHGGCQAILAAGAARKVFDRTLAGVSKSDARANDDATSERRSELVSMSATYLSAHRRGALRVDAALAALAPLGSVVGTSIKVSGTGRLTCEAVCVFSK